MTFGEVRGNMKTINILGTEYRIEYHDKEKDPLLEKCFGYMDETDGLIVVSNKPDDCEILNVENMQKKILRHEIIHCFLFESGLGRNTYALDGAWAENEEMVDWIAIQFPKILKVYEQLEIL